MLPLPELLGRFFDWEACPLHSAGLTRYALVSISENDTRWQRPSKMSHGEHMYHRARYRAF